MTNELLIAASLLLTYSVTVLFYRFFGNAGLYCWLVFATVAANIEVCILVSAFGMEQTLGNVLFASTFLVTDILSETSGKRAANRAVLLGMSASVIFAVLAYSWTLYVPAQGDTVHASVVAVFSNTPRIVAASLTVYAAVQAFDVFAYHFIWNKTAKLTGSSEKLLWLRNNLATMLSQLLNTVLYTLAAFAGVYPRETLIEIMISTYVIYFIAALLDTPAVYIARRLYKKGAVKNVQA